MKWRWVDSGYSLQGRFRVTICGGGPRVALRLRHTESPPGQNSPIWHSYSDPAVFWHDSFCERGTYTWLTPRRFWLGVSRQRVCMRARTSYRWWSPTALPLHRHPGLAPAGSSGENVTLAAVPEALERLPRNPDESVATLRRLVG